MEFTTTGSTIIHQCFMANLTKVNADNIGYCPRLALLETSVENYMPLTVFCASRNNGNVLDALQHKQPISPSARALVGSPTLLWTSAHAQ